MLMLVIEEAYDVGFGHKFLHFIAKIRLSRILQAVQLLNYFLPKTAFTI